MRRSPVPHPSFQLSFTLSLVGSALLILAAIGGLALLGLSALAHDPQTTEAEQQILLAHLAAFHHQLVMTGGAILVVFGSIGGYLSFKFIGPLVRLESWCEGFLAGNPKPMLGVRRGDAFGRVVRGLERALAVYFKEAE